MNNEINREEVLEEEINELKKKLLAAETENLQLKKIIEENEYNMDDEESEEYEDEIDN